MVKIQMKKTAYGQDTAAGGEKLPAKYYMRNGTYLVSEDFARLLIEEFGAAVKIEAPQENAENKAFLTNGVSVALNHPRPRGRPRKSEVKRVTATDSCN